MSLQLNTTVFQAGGAIPEKYSKEGGNISPPLFWSGVPRETKGLALIVDDPDAPNGTFVHWVVYAIPPAATGLDERMPLGDHLPNGAIQGVNGFNQTGYGGPKPPSGVHRYFFHLYALDTELDLAPEANREQLDRAMEGHVIEKSELFGTYRHKEPGS